MAGKVLGRSLAEREDSKLARCIERWTCPECGVRGQTSSLTPSATNIAAHFDRIHPHLRTQARHPSSRS